MDAMLSKALREFMTGQLNQLVVNLGGQDGDEWERELKRFLRKEPCWSNAAVAQVEPKPVPGLLEFVSTVIVPSTISSFVAKDRFVINTKRNAPVKIAYLSDRFREWFLGKIEEPMAETTLCYAKLLKSSVDGPILAELGEAQETALAQVYALMERQPNCESSALLTNGYANIFYVKDVNGILRAVCVISGGDGWYVVAYSVDVPSGWRDVSRVFSRNSLRSIPVAL
ncbi:MAG: hypothetical protein HY007_00940 [Candidatus Sungbacteria bacterium]|nr:hypothetical protein [Candidatus Sungbacteria bacterium]